MSFRQNMQQINIHSEDRCFQQIRSFYSMVPTNQDILQYVFIKSGHSTYVSNKSGHFSILRMFPTNQDILQYVSIKSGHSTYVSNKSGQFCNLRMFPTYLDFLLSVSNRSFRAFNFRNYLNIRTPPPTSASGFVFKFCPQGLPKNLDIDL